MAEDVLPRVESIGGGCPRQRHLPDEFNKYSTGWVINRKCSISWLQILTPEGGVISILAMHAYAHAHMIIKEKNIYRADRGRNPHLHVFSGSEPPTLSPVENLPQSLRSSPRWRRSWRPFQSGKLWEACAMDLNKSIYVPPTCKLRLLSISLLHKALCVPNCVMQSILFQRKIEKYKAIKAQSIDR